MQLASPMVLEAGQVAIQNTYTHAFRIVYLVSITFGVIGIVCAMFTKDVTHLMTAFIDIKLEEGAHIKSHANNTGGHIIHHVNSKEIEIETL